VIAGSNAKSIMGVMMLAAAMGTEVVIETQGAQEREAMDALLGPDCRQVWRKASDLLRPRPGSFPRCGHWARACWLPPVGWMWRTTSSTLRR